jgi:hypothetical protein
MFPGRALPTALLCVTLGSSAAAQTSDPLFAGLSFAPESVGSRPAGLGGAFVAVADDAKAAYANPAGLTLVPLTEVGLSSGERWGSASTSVLFPVHIAAYVTRHEQATNSLDSSTWEGGLSAAFRPRRRLSLGAGVAWSRLSLDTTESGAASGRVASGEDTHVRFTTGLLVDMIDTSRRALPALRLGISFQPGFDWSIPVARSAGATLVPVDVRRPSLVSAGLAWRPSDRWTIAVEGDLVRYQEVTDTLRRNDAVGAAGFGIPNAVEPRAGIEFGAPLWCGCGTVKVRGGVHYRSSGTLQYTGPDDAVARAFNQGDWETVATLGGSIFSEYFGHAFRFDIDVKDVFHGPDFSFGLVFRF